MKFEITKKLGNGALGRAGKIETPHGSIETPAFITVGTKATVKALVPEQVTALGAQAVLANTYHLYLQPGEDVLRKAGGLGKFMGWNGPTFTDSGGFQVFSLGSAFDKKVGKISGKASVPASVSNKTSAQITTEKRNDDTSPHEALAKIDEDGVTFKSVIDGSTHRFTPERSIEIQHAIGADIMFVFDECTSPHADHQYQREAMDRTHRWAQRSLDRHRQLENDKAEGKKEISATLLPQALFGIVQGGRFQDLREESARVIGAMDFDGFGIGGSFEKEDMYTAVGWVNAILPEGKPRHLLGIGEVEDFFGGIENGADTFDCVAPTRMARNGTLYTHTGKINIKNARFADDFSPVDPDCSCATCTTYTAAYLSHLFRADEMLAGTLASIHNLHFITHLVANIRQSIIEGNFYDFKKEFLEKYIKNAA